MHLVDSISFSKHCIASVYTALKVDFAELCKNGAIARMEDLKLR